MLNQQGILWMEVDGVRVWQANDGDRDLYLDLDGFMFDFEGHFRDSFGLECKHCEDDRIWALIEGVDRFFENMPLLPGAKEFYRKVENLRPLFLTTCPRTNYAHVAGQKIRAIRKHLSKVAHILPVMGSHHKPLFMRKPGGILIDDWGKNCREWTAAGGVAIKFEGDFDDTYNQLVRVLQEDYDVPNQVPTR